MKKLILPIVIFSLALAACGASSATDTAAQTAGADPAARTLAPLTQLVIGTFKLEGTDQAVTAEQAKELLPLWQVYSSLSQSDTAAQAEVDALVKQIQDTMTSEQSKAITAMNLTQKDVFALMQEQGIDMGGGARASSTQTAGGSNFGPGGGMPPDGGMPGGGMPPDGGGFPGGPGGSVQRSATPVAGSGQNTSGQPRAGFDRVPAPLLTALIDFLKERAAS